MPTDLPSQTTTPFISSSANDFISNMNINYVFIGIFMASSMIGTGCATTGPHRPIQFINDSGRETEIFLIDPSTGDLTLKSPGAMLSGETLLLNSFVNHTFFIREVPDRTGTCNAGTTYAAPSLAPCKTAFVKVNDHDDGKHIEIALNTNSS